ncbi:Sporulation and spore germination [Williamsia sterculiae]|uniref:Lipoprotein LpqB n=1 Tax=Williamsia sterculiae TaxID=1344003 RepID=A0A1N7GT46_9NOCA|nr:Sporulation and spore germination [Williamsia sterculiae]
MWLSLVIVVIAAVVGGCVSIPTSSSPQPIGSLERRNPSANVPSPTPGMDPESLVRAFLKAGVNPGSGHLAARQFLTTKASDDWDDRGGSLILGQINVLTDDRTADAFSVRLIGDNTGTLQSNGQLIPASGRVEIKLGLVRQNGEWRIDGPLPAGAILDRTVFENSYQSHSLYFPSTDGRRLVADPRWLYAANRQLPDQLIGLLIQGPSDDIARAVNNPFNAGSNLRGSITTDGGGVRMDLTGLVDTDDQVRTLLAAQIVWTLARNEIPGPYRIDADGVALLDKYPGGLQTTDVAALDPTAVPAETVGLNVIRGGALLKVEQAGESPAPGPTGTSNSIIAAALSPDGSTVAIVQRAGSGQSLSLARYGGTPQEVLRGSSITRPSFAGDANAVWSVVDGKVVRISIDPTSGATQRVESDSGSVGSAASGQITEFQVSRDGARVAMIVGGQVVLGVISTDRNRYSLGGVRTAAYNIGGPAVSLDWASGDTVVVARATTDTPVVQVQINGTPAVGLLSSNLTPPVSAVVANSSTIYVADSRGVLRLSSNNGEPDQYWNEVGPTMGSNSIPVLP